MGLITEEVVKRSRNELSGDEVMTLLLDRRGDDIKAAVGNGLSGDEIMTLLLDRRGDDIFRQGLLRSPIIIPDFIFAEMIH